jgi:hypothetical protein
VPCCRHCCCCLCPADLRAVATRLHTFITTRGYLKDPDGRTLKRVDESQTTHAGLGMKN